MHVGVERVVEKRVGVERVDARPKRHKYHAKNVSIPLFKGLEVASEPFFDVVRYSFVRVRVCFHPLQRGSM